MATEKRVMNAVSLITFGISKVIFPVNLSYDYSYNQIKMVDSWFDWRVLLGLGMVVGSVAWLIISQMDFPLRGPATHIRGNDKHLRGESSQVMIIGMMLFWGPILITGNLLFPIGTIFGERLWFWGSLGVVVLFAAIGSNRAKTVLGPPWSTGSRLRAVLANASVPFFAILIVWYAGRTVVRNFDWLSQERLFLHDVEYASQSVMAQNNAAAMHLLNQNLTEAKETMEEASGIYPQYPELLNNWGMYYLMTGDNKEAKMKFEECLLERPGNQLCQGNLDLLNKKRAIDKVK